VRLVVAILAVACLALCAGCATVYVTEDCKAFGVALGESSILVECPPEPEERCTQAEDGVMECAPVEKDVAVDGAGISEHLYKLLNGILLAFFKVSVP
jgi:hypothetical protein